MMTAQGPLQRLRQMKLLHQTKQQWDIIDALMLQSKRTGYHTAHDTEFGLRGSAFRERTVLKSAFATFTGTILSGGTTAGISGLVGDLAAESGGRIRATA